jgi:WD40 repeat protein
VNGYGKLLASAARDETIRLWDVATAKEQRQLREERGYVRTMAFTADDKTLVALRSAAPNTYTASMWDVVTGQEHSGQSFALESNYHCPLSPEPRCFAVVALDYKSIGLFDPTTGKELRRIADEPARLQGVAFSPDGRSITADSKDGNVRVWDVATGKLRHQFKALSGGILAAALSRDGSLLALNGEGAPVCIRIYDVARGKEIHAFRGHRSGPLTVAFARDGNAVITVDQAAVRTHPVETWADWSFRVWDIAAAKELRVTQVDPGGEVRLVVISPNARLIATVTHDGNIHLWDVASGKQLHHWMGPTEEVKWQVGREHKTAQYTAVRHAAFSSDGKTLLIPAGREGLIKRWDTATGKELPPLKAPLPTGAVFPSTDGRTLLVAAHDQKAYPDYPLLLLDAASGRLLRKLDTLVPEMRKALFTLPVQDGDATGSADGRTWAVKREAEGPVGPKVILFEAGTGQRRGVLEARHRLGAVAFSPNGRWLASGGFQVSLWDLATGRVVAHAPGPGESATSLSFSPDGKRLAVGGNDSAALVYDVEEFLKQAPAPAKPSTADREGLWKDLTGADAARAYQAIQRFAAAPESVAFLKEHLKVPAAPDTKRLAQLIADLDREDFEVREKATRELERIGPPAEPALRRALEGTPSAELRSRVEHLLQRLKPGAIPTDELIALRVLEALEIAGTPEARRFIKGLADGPADASLAQAAKRSLERLANRAGSAP